MKFWLSLIFKYLAHLIFIYENIPENRGALYLYFSFFLVLACIDQLSLLWKYMHLYFIA